jgi:starch synthase
VSSAKVKVAMITREWPPEIYGGAGVHITNLVSALRQSGEVESFVHCFGGARSDARNYQLSKKLSSINPALQTLLLDSDIAKNLGGMDIAHSHTWYANLAGYLAMKMFGIPHVITAHSLEPLRPWKAEQLRGGYQISSWAEKISYESASAIIAVSDGMRADVLKAYPDIESKKVVTIRNGIDTKAFTPNPNSEVLRKYGITSPYALFVGRLTRQKGLAHLLRAWQKVPKDYSLLLAAGSPDEPAIGAEVEELIAELSRQRGNIIWIKQMLDRDELTALLTGAQVFLCPSIYEPLGIVNLEAMACQTAVVASRVGGIPEVVVDNETGLLVDYSSNPSEFEAALASAITRLMSDKSLSIQYGQAGRNRVIEHFGWDKVAKATIELYRSLIK